MYFEEEEKAKKTYIYRERESEEINLQDDYVQ